MLFLLVLATSPWGLSKLWGGGVPTSNIEHSGPRLHRLLLLFNLSLLPHLFFSHCPDVSFPHLSYLLIIRSRFSLNPSQLSPAPHLLSRCEAPPIWTFPAFAARQQLPLVPVPRAACLHLMPFLCWFYAPFSSLSPHPVTCRPLGGLLVLGPSTYLCPCLMISYWFWVLVNSEKSLAWCLFCTPRLSGSVWHSQCTINES